MKIYKHLLGEEQCGAAFAVAEIKDDQEDAGEMTSASGRDLGSTKQQGLQRTEMGGEVSYVLSTLTGRWH